MSYILLLLGWIMVILSFIVKLFEDEPILKLLRLGVADGIFISAIILSFFGVFI